MFLGPRLFSIFAVTALFGKQCVRNLVGVDGARHADDLPANQGAMDEDIYTVLPTVITGPSVTTGKHQDGVSRETTQQSEKSSDQYTTYDYGNGTTDTYGLDTTQQSENSSAQYTTHEYGNGTTVASGDAWYENAARDIIIYGYGSVVGLGFITNTLTMITTTRPGLRESVLAVYLFALAVADTTVLLLSFLNNWLRIATGVFLIHLQGFCQFHSYLFDASYTCSAWFVVMMACERAIVVWFPLHSRYFCTRRVAVIATLTLPIIALAFFSYVPFAWHVTENQCVPTDYFQHFIYTINPTMTGTLYSYIPLCLIGISTIAIIAGICRAQMLRDQLSSDTVNNTRRACTTVVIISIFYLLFSVPVALWYMFVFSMGLFRYQPAKMQFYESIVQVWGALNHATNFFFYVLSASSFRNEFGRLCGCRGCSYKTT